MFRRHLLIGLTALMLVPAALACGNSANDVGNSGSNRGNTSVASASVVEFKETEYTLAPSVIKLRAGVTYTFRIQNVGQFPHDLHVATTADGTEMGGSTVILAGQTSSFTITLRPGQYTTWCAVNAHRSLGMEGTITVQ